MHRLPPRQMIALKNLAFQFFINIDDSEKKNIVKQIQVFVLVFDTLIMGKKMVEFNRNRLYRLWNCLHVQRNGRGT